MTTLFDIGYLCLSWTLFQRIPTNWIWEVAHSIPFVILLLTTTAAPVAAIAAPTPRAMDPHPHLEVEVVVVVVVVSADFSFSTVLLDTDDQRDDGLNPPGTELEELAPSRSVIPS